MSTDKIIFNFYAYDEFVEIDWTFKLIFSQSYRIVWGCDNIVEGDGSDEQEPKTMSDIPSGVMINLSTKPTLAPEITHRELY